MMEYTVRNYLVVYKFNYGGKEYTRNVIIHSRYLELNPDLIFYIAVEVNASVLSFIEGYSIVHNIHYLFDNHSVAILNIIPMNTFQTI